MLLRRFTDFVLQGRLQAIGTAFALTFVPLIGTAISILIAALVTLRRGVFEGALVLIAASVVYVYDVASYITSGEPHFIIIIMVMMIISNVMTWLLAVVLRQYGNWAFVLEFAGFLGVGCVIFIHLMYPDIQTWWNNQFIDYFNRVLTMMGTVLKDEAALAAQARGELVVFVKNNVVNTTGIVTAAILTNALLQLLIARWWQAIMFNPTGLNTELNNIRLSYAAGILFVMAAVLAYFGNEVALDTMPVFYLVFFAAAWSLLHYWAATTKSPLIWLTLAYFMLGLLFVLAVINLTATWFFQSVIVMVSVVAMLDIGLDFRKRLKR